MKSRQRIARKRAVLFTDGAKYVATESVDVQGTAGGSLRVRIVMTCKRRLDQRLKKTWRSCPAAEVRDPRLRAVTSLPSAARLSTCQFSLEPCDHVCLALGCPSCAFSTSVPATVVPTV